jgi:primosomal protein N''
MLETLAGEWGVEHHEIRPRHHEFVVGHLAEAEAAGRKHERALVQHHADRAEQAANEALRVNQAALEQTRINEARQRRIIDALRREGIYVEEG